MCDAGSDTLGCEKNKLNSALLCVAFKSLYLCFFQFENRVQLIGVS